MLVTQQMKSKAIGVSSFFDEGVYPYQNQRNNTYFIWLEQIGAAAGVCTVGFIVRTALGTTS